MATRTTAFGSRPSPGERAEREREAQSFAKRPPGSGERVRMQPPRVNPSLRAQLDPGLPLAPAERGRFAPTVGAAIDEVRVHEGARADQAAELVGFPAFASGPDIVLSSDVGQRRSEILAHEVAHATLHRHGGGGGQALLFGYEGPEHRQLGDEAAVDLLDFLRSTEGEQWARQHGLDPTALITALTADPFVGAVSAGATIDVGDGKQLSPGEVIALAGDFYAGPDELASADAGEVDEILGVITEQERGTIAGPDANLRFEEITGGRYTKLARKNAAHFAPKNRSAWQALHDEAMALARTDTSDEALQRAYLMDASGGHFLTDAFAAGHLIDVGRVEAEIAMHLMASPITAVHNPETQAILGGLAIGDSLIKLVLKNIHDRLNREGFEVSNARGMTWRTYGDDHLEDAPETRRIAALAVFMSRQQITESRAGQQPVSQDVLDLLPNAASVDRATEAAIALIPDAASESEVVSLMYSNAGMLRTVPLGFVLESLVRTTASPSRERQLLEAQENQTVAPQFTIFEW